MKLSDEEIKLAQWKSRYENMYALYRKKKADCAELRNENQKLMEERDRYREALEVIADHSKPFCALHLITKDKQIDDLMNTAKQALGTDDA
jgi:cell shape-determining protein MreC